MLLKEVYNKDFLKLLDKAISSSDPKFNSQNFLQILNNSWPKKELKERMRAIVLAMAENLSAKYYKEKIAILQQAAQAITKDKNSGLTLIIFADFVEQFGCEDFDISMQALEFFTEFGSSEFAVRKFLKIDEDRALKYFEKWSKSDNYHVRRLSSEGCRPRLPWGCALVNFKKDPSKIIPILDNLKLDNYEYVRRSVANNLNDICKDNPEIAIKIAKNFKEQGTSIKLISHGLRTLLKQGNIEALKLVGIDEEANKFIDLIKFRLDEKEINFPSKLNFSFEFNNRKKQKIRFEYAISFLKKNGSYSKKVFQIKNSDFLEGVIKISKSHLLKNFTTRKHYFGDHFIELIINGKIVKKESFILK